MMVIIIPSLLVFSDLRHAKHLVQLSVLIGRFVHLALIPEIEQLQQI